MAKKKQSISNVDIVSFAHKGEVIGKTQGGQVVIVENAVPGDNVDVMIYKMKKGLKWGRVSAINSLSPHRTEPKCHHFTLCGGCKWQHVDYEEQLRQKEQIVKDAILRIAKAEPKEWLPILGAEEIYYYRNKMEYTFSNSRWLTDEEIQSDIMGIDRRSLGLHRPGMFNKVIDITNCHLQNDIGDAIRNEIRAFAIANDLSFYNFNKTEGFLRSIIIRNNLRGEYMVTIVFGHKDMPMIESVLQHIADLFKQIISVYYVINLKQNDSLSDQEFIHYQGDRHLIEILGKLKYLIGPKSFFQTNSHQAKVLYDTILEFAGSSEDKIIYDLYSGTGSIGLYLASKAKMIIGIEEIAEAVADARLNAERNNIINAHFFSGLVEHTLDETFVQNNGSPDLLILDPPRMGIHPKGLDFIAAIGAPEIIYVSCNPATQARDLIVLAQSYILIKSQAIDMFPHTSHIENILLLRQK